MAESSLSESSESTEDASSGTTRRRTRRSTSKSGTTGKSGTTSKSGAAGKSSAASASKSETSKSTSKTAPEKKSAGRGRSRRKSDDEVTDGRGSDAEASGDEGGSGDEQSGSDESPRPRRRRSRSKRDEAAAKGDDGAEAGASDDDASDDDAGADGARERSKRRSSKRTRGSDGDARKTRGSDGDARKTRGNAAGNEAGKADGYEKSAAASDDASDAPRKPDPARISQHLSKFSDRAIQRVTGGNAFLRGRLYARRGHVHDIDTHGSNAKCRVQVKQDTYYEPKLTLTPEEQWVSDCNCPGFRGPTAHCKHVAALMVAIRDRERPPKPKQQQQPQESKKSKEKNAGKQEVQAHTPQTVSVGGKRSRRRRRRRGGGSGAETNVEVLSARELGIGSQDPRGSLDAWMPPDEQIKTYDLEFRMQVRSASITITPVLAGTRSAVPIADVLGGFNLIPSDLRPLLRALARHTTRGAPATAEIRGEDAAEVLDMLEQRRVLLEPASMELRFMDEPLRPKIELDTANAKAVRIRVIFESSSRRFPLSNGHWFEGTPGWHIDPTDGTARPVADSVTPAWLQRLYRSPALVHPTSDLPRLLTDFIPRVASSLGAELPDLSTVADLVDAMPEIRLDTNGDIVGARAKLVVNYDDNEFPVPPQGFPSPLEFLPPERGQSRPRVVRRDVGAEMAAVQRLLNLGFEPDEAKEGLVATGDDAVDFWTHGIAELPDEWDKRVPDDLAKVTVRKTSVTPQMRVSSGVDWLSLEMTFSTAGVAVDTDELRACLEHGRNLVKLSDGSYAPVKEEDVAEILERMAEIYAGTGADPSKLPLSQAGRVQDLMKLVGDAKISAGAKELFGKLGNVDQIPAIAKPRNLKVKKFRDYQKRGFSWLVFLHDLGTGGILADDMGLGKTLQTIALLLWVKNKQKKRKLNLVIAPTSVVPNWEREIQKFAPALRTVVWQGADRHDKRFELDDADIMITSYALLRRDEELLHALDLRYVVLDEAQHIKNPMSATARAAKALPSERRLALTGTPIENRLSEIWSIIDFVSPGLLGTLKSFEERYSRPIERGDMETAQKLRTIIHPLVMRRTKIEVAPELPEKIEQEIVVPMADEQSKLYKQMLKEVRDSVMSAVQKQGVAKAQIQILAALTRMRQVACDPRLTKLSGEWSDETSGKLQALEEIVQEAVAGGHRLLIFSQFVTMLGHIREMLDGLGVKYEYLDGSTKDRQDRVDRFNEDESYNAFLISLKAGGTGLNLTGADTVVHFDPWWNPAVEDQATDRAHRIGQTRVVTVYKLIARDSVEEKILKLSAKKRELVSNVLTTESTPLKGLTKADIDDLFS